jgi:hypothetical protein
MLRAINHRVTRLDTLGLRLPVEVFDGSAVEPDAADRLSANNTPDTVD